MNVRTKFEVHSFIRSWDNRVPKNLDTPSIRPRSFSPNFVKSFCSDVPFEYAGQFFEVRSFTHSWNNSSCSFGWGCEPQSWGRGSRRGSGMVPFERTLVSSYRLSIVTFPLHLRVSEILPILCSSTPLFPTPPLVAPKFPHVPLGVGGWRLG